MLHNLKLKFKVKSNQVKNFANMTPLITNKRVLIWLWMCPADGKSDNSMLKSLAHIAFGFTVFFGVVAGLISSFAYFESFVWVDLENSLYALFQVAAFLGLVPLFPIAISSRQKISQLLDNLSNIYAASMKF